MQIEINEAELRLLREAAMEFIEARGGGVECVPDYVSRRYAEASHEERVRHIKRVQNRVQIMQALLQCTLVTD